jgi:hypothetical protein
MPNKKCGDFPGHGKKSPAAANPAFKRLHGLRPPETLINSGKIGHGQKISIDVPLSTVHNTPRNVRRVQRLKRP